MAQSFWGGFAEGLGGGINYGLQIQEAKERKRLREEARKKAEEIQNVSIKISQMVEEGLQDGTWDYDNYSKTLAYSFSVPIELQDRLISINNALLENQFNRAEKEIASLDAILSDVKDMSWNNPEAIDAFWNNLEKQYVSSEAKKRIAIAREYTQAKHLAEQNKLVQEREKQEWENVLEIAKTLPQEERSAYLRQQGINIPEVSTEKLTEVEREINAFIKMGEQGILSSEQVNAAIESRLGIGRPETKAPTVAEPSKIREIRELESMGISKEEAIDRVYGAEKTGEDLDKLRNSVLKSYDAVTQGLIAPLNPEEQEMVNKRFETHKMLLPEEGKKMLEELLKADGYLPEATTAVKEPVVEEKGGGWSFWNWITGRGTKPTPEGVLTGKTPPPTTNTQPATTSTPTTQPPSQPPTAPQPSVPGIPPVNQKNYTQMTDDELKDAVIRREPGAIEEARRRGLL